MAQTVSVRAEFSKPERMSPGAAILLLVAVLAGFLKLFLPRWGMRWEYLYLMVGAAAVIVLDSIRAAIAARGRWLTGSPYTGQNWPAAAPGVGQQIGSGTVSSAKSEKSGAGTETWIAP